MIKSTNVPDTLSEQSFGPKAVGKWGSAYHGRRAGFLSRPAASRPAQRPRATAGYTPQCLRHPAQAKLCRALPEGRTPELLHLGLRGWGSGDRAALLASHLVAGEEPGTVSSSLVTRNPETKSSTPQTGDNFPLMCR